MTRTPSAKHFIEFGGFADGRRNFVASPDSEEIERTEPKVQERNFSSVEQIQEESRLPLHKKEFHMELFFICRI